MLSRPRIGQALAHGPDRTVHLAAPLAQPEQTRQERRQWALAYDEKAQGFAACRLLQQLGNPRLCAAADAFVQWHDEASRARTDLPLA